MLVGAADWLGGKPKVHSSGLSTLTWICSPELWLPDSFASGKWHCTTEHMRTTIATISHSVCTYLEVEEVSCCVLIWKLGKWVVVVAARQRGRRDIRCSCLWEWIMKPIENIVHICPHVHILWLSWIYRLTLLSHEWTNDTRKIRLIQVTWTEFQEWHKTNWLATSTRQLPAKSTIDQCWVVITNRNTPCTDIRVALAIHNHNSQFLDFVFQITCQNR